MRLPPSLVRVAARHRPAVPPRLLGATLDLASLVTSAPVTVLPTWRRVLVVAPHPDDESIGCGGTVATLTATGARVEVVLCTDGEATIGSSHTAQETARRRRAEAVAACRALGVTSLTPLGLPDGALADHLPTLASALDAAVRRTRPQVVFAPWVLERHPDHRAVPAALARTTTQVEVWGYEAHTPLHPTHAVPLADAAVAAKRRALAIHAATAGLAFDLEATLALARWRSLATRAGVGYAEAFHAVPAAELAGLVAATTAAWERAVNPAAAPDGPRAPER